MASEALSEPMEPFINLPAVLLFLPGDGPLHLPLALLLVFGTAKLLGDIFERLGQPALIGEIAAGVLLGPGVLHWVSPDDPVLSGLAEMGVMFLLFRVGLEVRAKDLWRVGPTASLVAVLGVVFPFLLGWGVMAFGGVSRIEALFVGAALVATSVGVTAQVLAARGLLQQRASRIILAAAVLDDILGLLVLTLVSSMARGHIRLISLIATSLIALGFTALIARYGTRTLQRVLPGIERRLAADEAQFHLALVVLFSLALAAVYVGIAALVGAFLAGMALSESIERRAHDLANGITELLVPFFLAGIGLHFDLHALANRHMLLLALALSGIAVVSKFLGCGLGVCNLGWTDVVRVGVGMVPRGEVGMVVAQMGLSLGVIEKPVYGVVVLISVITTVVTPPMLHYTYRNCRPELVNGCNPA